MTVGPDILRVLPPVHSPIPAAGLLRGVFAGIGGDGGVDRLARRIEESFDASGVLLADSGTSALRLAIAAAVRMAGGPVALPAYGCYDLLTAAHGAEVDALFYDVDPGTLGPDLASLREALERGGRIVVLAYLFGRPIDLDAVGSLVERHEALLIEDAAQGVGGAYRGAPLGAHGDLSVLSFGRGKGRTGGGGGALLANSGTGGRLMREMPPLAGPRGGPSSLAKSAAQWLLARPALYAIPRAIPGLGLGETTYREPWPPAAMNAVSAVLLDRGWDEAEEEVEVRSGRARAWEAALAESPGVETPPVVEVGASGDLRQPALLDGRARRAVEGGGWRRLGIAPGYPRPLHRVKPRPGDLRCGSLEGAERLAAALWTFPTHRYVTDADIHALAAALAGERARRTR